MKQDLKHSAIESAGYHQTVTAKYLRMPHRKVRLVASVIRRLPVSEAEAQLLLSPQRAAKPVLKLLRSAMANAKANKNILADKLYVKSIAVGQGPMMKRFMPRAFGRATEIQKKMCHLWITVAENPKSGPARFVITPPIKKAKDKNKRENLKPKSGGENSEPRGKQPGIFKRIFNRKSV